MRLQSETMLDWMQSKKIRERSLCVECRSNCSSQPSALWIIHQLFGCERLLSWRLFYFSATFSDASSLSSSLSAAILVPINDWRSSRPRTLHPPLFQLDWLYTSCYLWDCYWCVNSLPSATIFSLLSFGRLPFSIWFRWISRRSYRRVRVDLQHVRRRRRHHRLVAQLVCIKEIVDWAKEDEEEFEIKNKKKGKRKKSQLCNHVVICLKPTESGWQTVCSPPPNTDRGCCIECERRMPSQPTSIEPADVIKANPFTLLSLD